MPEPASTWAAEARRTLSPEETAAYARMHAALTRRKPPADDWHYESTHAVLAAEESPADLTTEEGRKLRSARNLRYLHEQSHDCPKTLLHELHAPLRLQQGSRRNHPLRRPLI
jgi:hypothetical protein